MRHEWIEAVFRVALGRYEASHPDLNPGGKVGLLFDQYILREVSIFLEQIFLLSNYLDLISDLVLGGCGGPKTFEFVLCQKQFGNMAKGAPLCRIC